MYCVLDLVMHCRSLTCSKGDFPVSAPESSRFVIINFQSAPFGTYRNVLIKCMQHVPQMGIVSINSTPSLDCEYHIEVVQAKGVRPF